MKKYELLSLWGSDHFVYVTCTNVEVLSWIGKLAKMKFSANSILVEETQENSFNIQISVKNVPKGYLTWWIMAQLGNTGWEPFDFTNSYLFRRETVY